MGVPRAIPIAEVDSPDIVNHRVGSCCPIAEEIGCFRCPGQGNVIDPPFSGCFLFVLDTFEPSLLGEPGMDENRRGFKPFCGMNRINNDVFREDVPAPEQGAYKGVPAPGGDLQVFSNLQAPRVVGEEGHEIVNGVVDHLPVYRCEGARYLFIGNGKKVEEILGSVNRDEP